jgi:hypothetical protein
MPQRQVTATAFARELPGRHIIEGCQSAFAVTVRCAGLDAFALRDDASQL